MSGFSGLDRTQRTASQAGRTKYKKEDKGAYKKYNEAKRRPYRDQGLLRSVVSGFSGLDRTQRTASQAGRTQK